MAEWLPVVGYEGRYEVSDRGQIRKTDRTVVGQWKNEDGYLLARLSRPRKLIRVHRIVAEAFIDNPDGLPCVNHIDCIRDNNAAINLEWCTQKQNLKHSADLGRMQRDYWVGKRTPIASLSDDQVREIRRLYKSGSHSWASIGKMFGVSKRCAGRAISGETYADVK